MFPLYRSRFRFFVSSCLLSPFRDCVVVLEHLISPSIFSNHKLRFNESSSSLSCRMGYGGHDLMYKSYSSGKRISSAYRKRRNRRLRALMAPVLDDAKFQKAVSMLPARFNNEELFNVMTLEDDPVVCLELFKWAGQQPRFWHDASTFHVTIRKLGAAKMYEEMENVVKLVLAVPHICSEAMFNSIIYFFAEARKLSKAVTVFKHMRKSMNLDCRPTIMTYHILFKAMLSRGKNSLVNRVYMENLSCLFRQMVKDDIEPDLFSLNSMIKGYVISLHVNDALRLFHQMGVVYNCLPNSFTYDYLIHGLCAQGRTTNATELCDEMKKKGFVPSGKSYNSLVNAFTLGGKIDEALQWLWEMVESQRPVDYITYRSILDEMCRKGKQEEAMALLNKWNEMNLVNSLYRNKLLCVLDDDYRI